MQRELNWSDLWPLLDEIEERTDLSGNFEFPAEQDPEVYRERYQILGIRLTDRVHLYTYMKFLQEAAVTFESLTDQPLVQASIEHLAPVFYSAWTNLGKMVATYLPPDVISRKTTHEFAEFDPLSIADLAWDSIPVASVRAIREHGLEEEAVEAMGIRMRLVGPPQLVYLTAWCNILLYSSLGHEMSTSPLWQQLVDMERAVLATFIDAGVRAAIEFVDPELRQELGWEAR